MSSLKSYILDSDNEEKQHELLAIDATLSNLNRELDRAKSQFSAGSKTIQNELGEQLSKFETDLKAKADATLNLIGRSDHSYIDEITKLKDDLNSLVGDRQRLSDMLESGKKNEKAMNIQIKALKEKINVFENVEDTKGPWFDIEAGSPMDLDRITKALSKSTQLISVLQAKIERLSKNSS